MPIQDLTKSGQADGSDAIFPEPGKNPLLYGFYYRQKTEDATASGNISASQSNKVFTNKGATALVTLTLPHASQGLTYTFYVQDIDGIKISAQSGQTIRIGSSASTSFQSTTIGSSVTLVAISTTEWVCTGGVSGFGPV